MRQGPVPDGRPRSRRGRLRPDELAESVILADLTLALCLVGHLLPLASVLFGAAVVPMAAVAARHRLRAVLAGAVAACAVGFLIAGGGLLPRGVSPQRFGDGQRLGPHGFGEGRVSLDAGTKFLLGGLALQQVVHEASGL